MAYFRYLPKVYVRNRTIKDGVHPYELCRNIFRRIKIKDDLQGPLLGFLQYEIEEGERPDQVARKFYGDSGLDWIVLIINNIINVNQDWPMTRADLYAYVEQEFGNVDLISHYESNDIFATDGTKVFSEGIVVNENFQYIRPDGTVVPKAECRHGVTYFEVYYNKNEEKRNIYLLREDYVTDFINEFKKLAKYLPHGEVDDQGNKKTQTSIAEEFIGISTYRKPSQSTASTGSAQGGGSSTALISSGSSTAGTAPITTVSSTTTINPNDAGTIATTQTNTTTQTTQTSSSGGGY
tara:strand:- start:3837 stop:4718 length:882 start_codon:yes stop_codon:yes gene_type:complete